MQNLETKSSRPKSFETETRPSRPRLQKTGLETPSLVSIITKVAKNIKRASTQKYLRVVGNLCSSAAYINF